MSVIKDKFKAFIAKMGFTATETTPHGIFFKEEEVDRLMAIDTENDKLKTEAATKDTLIASLTTERDNAVTAKDAALVEKKTAEDALALAQTTITNQATEIKNLKAKLSGKPEEETEVLGAGGATSKEGKYSWSEKNVRGKA